MDSTIENIHKFLGGHRGRLYQQGVVNKAWKPRFFVLERRRIRIFSDETLFRINGEVTINENTVVYDVPGENSGRKFLFYVYSRDAVTADDVLFLSAQSRRDKMEWMEAIMDSVHNGFKLVNQPELWLDAFYPKVDVAVSYGMISVEYGNMLKPQMVEQTPTVALRLADPNAVYSLVMIDLDSIHANGANKTVFLHWGIVNIQGGHVGSGTEVAPYWSPAPEYDSGLHRYFFLVFTQNFILTASQLAETTEAFQQRERFSYLDWIRGRNMGEPVGLNGFYAGWEEYCATIHEKQQYDPPEDYLLTRQDQFLQKEAEAIWVEDSKMQLFQDLSLADLFPANADISATPVGSIAMMVRYGQEAVGGGVTVSASVVAAPPQVTYTPHQAEISGFVAGTNAIAVDFGLYTLMMVDADAGLDVRSAGSNKPSQERVHWLVLNIPQSNINDGVAVVPYQPPRPGYGTGLHRYVLCLYKQKKVFTSQQIDSSRAYFSRNSLGLKSHDWVRSYSAVLLNVPVGLEAFLCEWDESVGAPTEEKSLPSPRNSEDEVYLTLPQFGSRSSASSVVSSSTGVRRGASASASVGGSVSAAELEKALEDEQESADQSEDSTKAVEAQPRGEVQQQPSAPTPPQQQYGGQPVRQTSPAKQLEASTLDAPEGKDAVAVDTTVQVVYQSTAGRHPPDAPSQSDRGDGSAPSAPAQVGRTALISESEMEFAWSPPVASLSMAVGANAPVSGGPEAAKEVEQRVFPGASTDDDQVEGNSDGQVDAERSVPAENSPRFQPQAPQQAAQQQSNPPPAYDESPARPREAPRSPSRTTRTDGPSLTNTPGLSPQQDRDSQEGEERERRDRKKQLQRQREAELERFEAERVLEEQRRRETAQAEERRRLERLQAEEMDRVMEEKRRRAKADQEKLRKQEEMRRAMQEHELAEAERVRQEEARADEERQRALLEKAEEQRRLESKQAEELQRAQEEAAAEAERQRQVEERAAEDKRRLMLQRSADEEEGHLRGHQQHAETKMYDQRQRSPRDHGFNGPDLDGRGPMSPPGRQQATGHPMGLHRSPAQPLAPAIKLRTSFGNVVVDSNRGLIEAPPASRYGVGRSDSITDPQSSSDSNPELHHGEFESESVLSALSSGTSVNSKMQRSVSFATVISTTSDDSYWVDAEDTGSSGDRDWRDRRLRKERERERSRYMEQQMLESIESEEMRRVRMQELEEQRLREEAAEAKARQHRLRQEHQREVERLQKERAAAAEAARLQQLLERQREQEEATMEFLRREAVEEEQRRLADEAEARRLQEEQDRQAALELVEQQRREEDQGGREYQEHLQLQLRMQQLAEDQSVQSSVDSRRLPGYDQSTGDPGEEVLDDDGDWGGYDDEHDDGLEMHGGLEEGEIRPESPAEDGDHTVGAVTASNPDNGYGRDDAFGVQFDEELNQQLAEERPSRSSLIDDHLDYFDNDRDEKATQDSNDPSGVVSVEGDDQDPDQYQHQYQGPYRTEEDDQKPMAPIPPVLPLSGMDADREAEQSTSPNSSPGRSVPSTSASTISRSGTHTSAVSGGAHYDGSHGFIPNGSVTSRSFDLSDSESSGGRFLSPDARHSSEITAAQGSPPLSPPAPPTPTTPPTPRSGKSLSGRGKATERLNLIAEGVARARNSQDLCTVFEITTKSIFDGDRLKKKYSTDFMAKDSAVWIDPQKRSLHWGKKPLDAASSKFILLEPYSKANPNLPSHLRPQGENKGTCKAVTLVDASTFKVTLWSDDSFVGKLLGDNAAEKTNDWVKVINSFQRR